MSTLNMGNAEFHDRQMGGHNWKSPHNRHYLPVLITIRQVPTQFVGLRKYTYIHTFLSIGVSKSCKSKLNAELHNFVRNITVLLMVACKLKSKPFYASGAVFWTLIISFPIY